MKGFAGKLEVPFEIEHTEIVTCYCSRPGEVRIELDEGGQTSVHPMREVFTDIYIYEMLMFREERIPYRVYTGNGSQPAIEGVLLQGQKTERENPAFYGFVDRMIGAKESGDKREFDRLVAQYKSRHQIAELLLKPIEEER